MFVLEKQEREGSAHYACHTPAHGNTKTPVSSGKVKDSYRQDLGWSLLPSVSLLNCIERRNFSRIYTLSSRPWKSELSVCPLEVREWMSADDDECRMPTMSVSATHTTLWTVEEGKKHLQCEAGRARVPMGQLVRQFGSGQTDRERREKQVGWKVFQTVQV